MLLVIKGPDTVATTQAVSGFVFLLHSQTMFSAFSAGLVGGNKVQITIYMPSRVLWARHPGQPSFFSKAKTAKGSHSDYHDSDRQPLFLSPGLCLLPHYKGKEVMVL